MSTHSHPDPSRRQPDVHIVEARVHGRYLVRQASAPPPWPLLVGFHGQGEDAAAHLRELESIPGSDRWLVVAAQALHPFYTRNGERVVASWMTRLDREHAIADNIAYVGNVLGDVRTRYSTRAPLVFAGFSQGGAMAYRAAGRYAANGLLILAADLPPDVAANSVATLPRTLIGRGLRDQWYTEEKQASDTRALAGLGVETETCVFDEGHVWADPFRQAAANLLRRLLV